MNAFDRTLPRGVGRPKLLVLTTLTAACVLAALLPQSASAQAPAPAPPGTTQRTDLQRPPAPLPGAHTDLSDHVLREAVAALERGEPVDPVDGPRTRGNQIRAEVVHSLGIRAADDLIRSVGGSVIGSAGDSLVEAWIPFDQVEGLEQRPGVTSVRDVVSGAVPPVTNAISGTAGVEAVTKTGAATWHNAGYTGAGVKIGIIDYFDATAWNLARSAGEVPSPAGTFCWNGGDCAGSFWSAGSRHGVAVAEVIHDIAPGAALYLATTGGSASDIRAAVDWLASNGVRIISRSLGSSFDGPGDGSGPPNDVVTYAASKGITWFNSAGNYAGAGSTVGGYWRGSWNDSDGDGWLDFAAGDELLSFGCDFLFGLRWNDWGSSRTDYDAYIYEDAGGTILERTFTSDQTAGADPIERLVCDGSGQSPPDRDYLAIRLYKPGAGTTGDTLEFLTNGRLGVEYWSNPFSATQPFSDSRDVISVGAVGDNPYGTTIAPYSSQGPTNDGRIKPDLSAVTCTTSFTYSPGCFNGTSASTPAVAATAALALQRWATTSPTDLRRWLVSSAVADRGSTGPDSSYGAGEVRLPSLTAPSPGSDATAGVTGLSGAAQVTGGSHHTCARLSSGQVRCWGDNSSGQLGNGTTTSSPSVVSVTGMSGVTQITAGAHHTCALVASGQVRCWGDSRFGQLGNGTTTNSATLTSVTGLSGVSQITAGAHHTCALLSAGQVRCWGRNDSGQLGNGTTTNSSTLASVTGLTRVTQIRAGGSHTCAIVSGGQVRCWGRNNSGQLGNGTTTSSSTLTSVVGLSGVTQLTAGAEHTCALVAGGQARCWGNNDVGQIGNGTRSDTAVASAVTGLSGATNLTAGHSHSCALVAGGQARCWGHNTFGQLGNGTTSPTTLTGVTGLSGATQFTAGDGHTCALVAGGQARCWGDNSHGQLGNGTVRPIA